MEDVLGGIPGGMDLFSQRFTVRGVCVGVVNPVKQRKGEAKQSKAKQSKVKKTHFAGHRVRLGGRI